MAFSAQMSDAEKARFVMRWVSDLMTKVPPEIVNADIYVVDQWKELVKRVDRARKKGPPLKIFDEVRRLKIDADGLIEAAKKHGSGDARDVE